MNTPTQTLWIDAETQLPDSDLTVLIHHQANDEPVWLGYHDGETWRDVNAEEVQVSHWMDMPAPPEEVLEFECRDTHGALERIVRLPRNSADKRQLTEETK
jgi:hypothetical protein